MGNSDSGREGLLSHRCLFRSSCKRRFLRSFFWLSSHISICLNYQGCRFLPSSSSFPFFFKKPEFCLFFNSFDFPRSYYIVWFHSNFLPATRRLVYHISILHSFFYPFFSGLFFHPVSFHLFLLLCMLSHNHSQYLVLLLMKKPISLLYLYLKSEFNGSEGFVA